MKIAVSCGDLNGIGLETLIKGLPEIYNELDSNTSITLFSNLNLIKDYCDLIGLDYKITDDKFSYLDYKLKIENTTSYFNIDLGKTDAKAGQVAFESLQYATQRMIDGEFDALVTLPISKEAMHLAGFSFPGHTEYLAEVDKKENPLMILFNDKIKVALATIHIPISKVPSSISIQKLNELIFKFQNSLSVDFGLENPKIAVLGLNPHAGENGDIGNEEIEIINKSIIELQSNEILVEGTFPADGFFGQHLYSKYDGVFAMYHDQGLIPMKMLSVNGGVNFSAGLSFVRTSPDHGTAFAIAGKNLANPKSTLQSIIWAEKIVNFRKNR
ncbi:MAG: 4-hydroxythreonine-4-phosphate dehydrogenase PdxA [Ignavibacteria bacterium GWF2_33_9]|nr:MAG: 4-hydroxythreonine-4-phosphate dehydrogenase PdxA [Ignavibacteria bacterium GWF2_33_9]